MCTTSYVYNGADGMLSASVDPLGRRTEMTYDGHGNVTLVKYLVGTPNQYQWSYQYTTWDFHNLWKATDPRGLITTYSYDMRGRLIQVADPLANLTKFAYNSNGLVTQVTDPRN
ncbi:MAG: RHS repeat domain-containing protein, partial [Burkholderiales bacterium]